MTRFSFKTIILLSVWFATTALVSGFGFAQTKPAAEQQIPQLLFVQNTEAVVTDKSGRVLTLKGLSPTTLYFSDRPVRLAGHYRTSEFLKFWKAGPDSFLKDPPNATLSVFQKGNDDLVDAVARLKELMSMLNQGLITQSQSQEESQKILNQLTE